MRMVPEFEALELLDGAYMLFVAFQSMLQIGRCNACNCLLNRPLYHGEWRWFDRMEPTDYLW